MYNIMLIILLLLIPLCGVLLVSTSMHYPQLAAPSVDHDKSVLNVVKQWLGYTSNYNYAGYNEENIVYTRNLVIERLKSMALKTSILTLFVSLVIFALFDFSSNQFQFVQEHHDVSFFSFYIGVDGLSIYFVLLTTIIMPISLLSN